MIDACGLLPSAIGTEDGAVFTTLAVAPIERAANEVHTNNALAKGANWQIRTILKPPDVSFWTLRRTYP
ncbi:MAG TPA: hypothetical protein VEN79_08115, partial [Terriglobia bacterium]|nr:hypothetical protein [Terriglobia bacterium]